MKHRLFIVEGLPCSGKSTLSAYLAKQLEMEGNVCFVDEGTGNHPADYEYHALAPAGLVSAQEEIVSLSGFSDEMLERLLSYKIYDALPWETEMPLMLEKWQQFVADAQEDTIYVFNCVLLQNPMCETMMRFGFPEEVSSAYIQQIARRIQSMNPVILYLKNDDIVESIQKTDALRPGWLEAVINYHVNGAYGRSIGAKGFDGYICCLEERQRRELRILAELPLNYVVFDNPQRAWRQAEENVFRMIRDKVWNCREEENADDSIRIQAAR